MGLFKSISKSLGLGSQEATLLGGAAGFFMPGGGLASGFIGAGLAGSLFADDPQVEALRAAGKLEEAARLRAEKYQQFIIEQTAGQRAAGQRAIGQLEEEVSRQGLSPLAQRSLKQGQVALQQNLAGLGLGDSSVSSLAQGELAAGVTAGEISRRQGILGALAGQASAGLGTGLGALQLQSGLAGRQAQTLAGIGGVQAAGQQAQFGNLLQLGLASQLGLFGNQRTGQTGGFIPSGFGSGRGVGLDPNRIPGAGFGR